MNVLIIGSGGREHALAWKSAQDENVQNVYVCPGNAGTHLENKISNVDVDSNNFEAIEIFCIDKLIDLVIIGPEQPLVIGLSDYLQSKGINTFGPSKSAAQLEGSKTFSKDFFIKYNIPTAGYKSFDNYEHAINHLKETNYPTVVKADGLAAGKGVIICSSEDEAIEALKNIFKDKAFGAAGNRVVIEDFLEGEEASFIAVVSKDKIIPLATSQDHKTVGDGDVGLNTGGMGAYSPAPIINDSLNKKILDEVMYPTMQGLINEGSPYLGFLYAGLMINNGEIKVLEFNCRFGDPETQPIMMRLKSDLADLCNQACSNSLEDCPLEWDERKALGVVIASEGYPFEYEKNKEIKNIPYEQEDIKVFHAGTKYEAGKIKSNGGRVLCVTTLGNSVQSAQVKAYDAITKIQWDDAYYRKDIGYRAVEREKNELT